MHMFNMQDRNIRRAHTCVSSCQVLVNPSFSHKYVHASIMSWSSLQANVFELDDVALNLYCTPSLQNLHLLYEPIIIFVHILSVNSKQHTSKHTKNL